MSLNEQKDRFNALDNWFLSDLGMQAINAFSKELESVSSLFYGKSLVQLGNCGKNHFISQFNYQEHWIISPDNNSSINTISLLNQLPFGRNTVDCVLAPFTFEALSHDKTPIDEIDRILKPMGYVIFWGINPFSLWGLWLHGKHNCFGQSKLRTKSMLSVKRAMVHRGYIQSYASSFYYLPPFQNKLIWDKLKVFNELGRLISPLPAGFYCLVMQKYEENYALINYSYTKKIIPNTSLPLQPTCRKSNLVS